MLDEYFISLLFEQLDKKNFVMYSVSKQQQEKLKSRLTPCNFRSICFFDVTNFHSNELSRLQLSCTNHFQRAMLADRFLSTHILNAIISQMPHCINTETFFVKHNKNALALIENGDLCEIIGNISLLPSSLDVKNLLYTKNNLNLNIFCEKIENKYLQQSINNFLAHDNNISVKLFIESENLLSEKKTNSESLKENYDFYVVPKHSKQPFQQEFVK